MLSMLPVFLKIMEGNFDLSMLESVETQKPQSVHVATRNWRDGFASAQPGSVAVIPVKGTITKERGWWGTSTNGLMRVCKECEQNSNITAIVLEGDSGGGEGTNISTTGKYLQSLDIPIFTSTSGLNASAAYGISAGTDKIFASQKTDIFGSIGVVQTIFDFSGYYEKQGIKLHEIFSSLSTEKRIEYIEAFKGNYKPLKEKLLDPFATDFIETIKTLRPGIHESMFKGGVEMAEKAQEKGLIDGVMTLDEVIQYAHDNGRRKKSNSRKKRNFNMATYSKLDKIVGFSSIEIQDDQISLSVDDFNKIYAQLPEQPKAEENQKSMLKLINGITKELKGVSASFEAITGRLDKIEEGDAAEPAAASAGNEDPPGGDIELKGDDKILAELNASLGIDINNLG